MTDAIPIFIKSLFTDLEGKTPDKQAKNFIEGGQESIALAEEELNYADIAFAQTGTDSENQNLQLAEIARRHYAQAFQYFGEAVDELGRAGKPELPAKYNKYIRQKTRKCLEEMDYAKARIIELGVILRTNR